jgi:formylglycine-generating enzyme required for sulfatase activity
LILPRRVDPHGAAHGGARIIRGGGFDSPSFALRTTYRARAGAGERHDTIGFRCAYDR